MRVIGKVLASAAALAFVASMTAASAAPFGSLAVDSQLSPVADKKAEPAKAPAKAEAKKAEPAKAEAKKAEPAKAEAKKPAAKKVVKKAAKKKVAKKGKGKGKSCGVGKYKKGGKCMSAADKK